MAKKPHKATEQRTIEEALRLLPEKERNARTVLERLKQMVPIPAGAFILDIGAAQPWKARRMLRTAGFRRVYDRWDLRQPSEGGRLHALLLRVIRLSPVTKCMADVLVGGCAYAAVK
jgi:hypothetical protein